MALSKSSEPLHVILFPLMAPGHIIPMIDMAKVLTKQSNSIQVSVIVTPLDSKRFSPVINRAVTSGLSIKVQEIKFPAEEAGLPRGCESTDCLPSYDLIRNFFVAITLLQQPMEQMLREMNPSPNCIICDKNIAWLADTCHKFQIPRIVFDGMGCFAHLAMHNLYVSKIHETVSPDEPFVIPGLPDKVEVTKRQLPGYFNPGLIYVNDFRKQVIENELKAYGNVVNSFDDLEKRYLDELQRLKGGKVWCIGPLSLCNDESLEDRAERGNQTLIDREKCLEWLDGKNPGSVVYACLGSLSRISPSQFVELASGLESSGHPFVLVIKEGDDKSKEIEKWISDEGFEERTKERGLLIRGWAPQVLILSHPSIGGFLMHCGWNSTLEALSSGVPMITWPIFAEQFLNEKLIVQVLGVGLGVGSQQAMHLEDGAKAEAVKQVTRDGISSAIRRVMDEREGSGRRKRAKELGEKARRSVQEGGSSDVNVRMLIQEIQRLAEKNVCI